jgi:hypothetical protein
MGTHGLRQRFPPLAIGRQGLQESAGVALGHPAVGLPPSASVAVIAGKIEA